MSTFTFAVTEHNGYSLVELVNNSNSCRATINTTGAILQSYEIAQASGEWLNIIDADPPEEVKTKMTEGFKGAKLAPFVCRMNHGKYTFHNNHYRIEKFYLKEHAIHGLVYDQSYEIKRTYAGPAAAGVELQTHYYGQDAGYPFQFTLTVNWELSADNKLSVTTVMTHINDQDVLFADGWHPYFTLGGNLDEWELQFAADQQVAFNHSLIPTGELVADTRFTSGVKLAGIELDNCFKLTAPYCRLSNGHLRLLIVPGASYPYLQVYIPEERNSIAIENLSSAPDSFNNGMGLLVARPNEAYTFVTTYQLTTF
jgi:aldose 1-epimerase